MNREKAAVILLCAVLFISLLSGCTQPKKTVVIGALLPLSGNLSSSGMAAQAGLEVAVDDVNTYMADKGMKVRLVIEDDETNPSIAVAKIKKLKETGAKFIIGPDSSASLEAVKTYADENGIILISHGSTAPSLSIASDNVFRLLPDDTSQAEAMADMMRNDGINVILPVWRGDIWGQGLYEATKTDFVNLGGTVVDGVRYDPNTDFSNELELLRSKVDSAVKDYGKDKVAVYFLGFQEVVNLFERADNTSVSNVKWYGSAGTALGSDLINNKEAARFAMKTGFLNPYYSREVKDKYSKLEEKTKAKVGVEHLYALTAYDALWLSALAYISSNGSSDVNVLKKALIETASSYDGATGPTILNEAGDRRFASYDFWAVNETGGRFNWFVKYTGDPVLTELDVKITTIFNKIDNDLSNASLMISKTGLNGTDARNILNDLCNSSHGAIDCATVDEKGIMLAIEPGNYSGFEGSNISKQEHIIRLHRTGKPVMSEVFKTVEGIDAVAIEYPVYSASGKFIGSVSLLIRADSLFSSAISQLQLQRDVWAMQKDGKILYDPVTEEIGKMLFEDPSYKPYPELLSLGRRIAEERMGSGSYEYPAMGQKEPVKKEATWSTVGLYGTEWRLVVTHVRE